MADEPETDEVRRLLHETAIDGVSGPDMGAIRGRIRRRRGARRGAAGLLAIALVGGGVALASTGADEPTQVEVVDEPPTTATSEVEDLGAVGALAPEGIAIQVVDAVELRGLDGELLHRLDGYELATVDREDGLASTVTNVVPLRSPDGALWWLDPASGLATEVGSEGGAPLWNGAQVVFDPDRGVRSVVLGGPEREWRSAAQWQMSSEHRAASLVDVGYFDSGDSSERPLPPRCWVAALSDSEQVQVCEQGGAESVSHFVYGSGGGVVVPEGADGASSEVRAAWLAGSDVLVRVEHGGCPAATGMVLRDGSLLPLLDPGLSSVASSAPIGVALDGRAIVHLDPADCESAGSAPGVHLVDLATGERELVWSGSSLLDHVRAWTTLPLAAEDVPPEPVHPESAVALYLADLETIAPEEIGRDLLVFGDAGISRIDGGQRSVIWSEPVERAFDDGAGGVVFQDRSQVTEAPDGRVDVQRGAVRAMNPFEPEPTELVPASDRPLLWAVLPFDADEDPGEPPHGRPEVHAWLTREHHSDPDPLSDWSTTLHRVHPRAGGQDEDLGIVGGPESGLDGIARLGDGRVLFSTCHIQCAIRDEVDNPEPIVMPHWLGGLDGTPTTWGYVRFGVPAEDGRPTAPVLTVHDLADEVVSQVRLPDEIGWETFVDLSDDGTAALVWSRDWQTGEVTGPVYVDRLDTDDPRVRAIASGGQAVRFAE